MTKTIILLLALFSTGAHAENNAEYQLGTKDGCTSANQDIYHAFTKDVDKYIKEPYYKAGWDDGFLSCKAQRDVMNKILQESGW